MRKNNKMLIFNILSFFIGANVVVFYSFLFSIHNNKYILSGGNTIFPLLYNFIIK